MNCPICLNKMTEMKSVGFGNAIRNLKFWMKIKSFRCSHHPEIIVTTSHDLWNYSEVVAEMYNKHRYSDILEYAATNNNIEIQKG